MCQWGPGKGRGGEGWGGGVGVYVSTTVHSTCCFGAHFAQHIKSRAQHAYKELTEIAMLFIRWYMLYCRQFLPKDEVDVKEMIVLGEQ